ncbi:crossover junction endonuclease MUS81, partial [Chroicocephalus ridibundus]|uniref:crossover junction endonuclease MUS81 n=1 Tax=Chroicocephalus ridibundus TaxID=1192867 RepID=UPI002FDDD1FC
MGARRVRPPGDLERPPIVQSSRVGGLERSPPEQPSAASRRPRAAAKGTSASTAASPGSRPCRRPPPPRVAAAAAAPPPNPLFTRWLREWRDEAAGTRVRGVYERALRSLARYPLPLRSGRAAAILQHFGPALCRRLELRLRQHRAEQGLAPSPPAGGRGAEPPPAPPTRRPSRDYRPLPRSRAYALLMALHQSPSPLAEAELLRRAQPRSPRPLPPVSAVSRDQSERGKAALGPLLRRDLLQRSGHPPRYSLTPRGQILAQRLADAAPAAPPPPGGTPASEGGGPLAAGGGHTPPPSPT